MDTATKSVQPQVENRQTARKWPLSLLITGGVLIPLLGTAYLGRAFPEWTAASLPVHSTFEVSGAAFGIVLALVLLFSRQHNCTTRRLFVACALISMGVLDIFHSCVPVGQSFVWLHSIAVLGGGLFFALAWVPKRKIFRRTALSGALTVLVGSILIGALSIRYRDQIPAMVTNGRFTLLADIINLTGGWLTILGGAAFAWFYYQRRYVEDIVFLLICFLFGTAGLLFHFSDIWHAGWWFWHALRLGGYLLPLWLALFAYRAAEEKTIQNRTNLAMAIAQGDFSTEIEPDNDEDALGKALRSMAHSLRDKQQEIERRNWIRTSLSRLDDIMRGEKELSTLCADIITTLAHTLDVPIGTLSITNADQTQLTLAAGHAFQGGSSTSFRFGEGLIGQAAQNKTRILATDVPKNYLPITSTLTQTDPANILCVPLLYEKTVEGVIELGALRKFTDLQLQLLDQAAERIAIALHGAQAREKMKTLLEESRSQAEELQAQQEELRVTNEELEEKNSELETRQEEQSDSESREI
jgi:GAF domain-containing protein